METGTVETTKAVTVIVNNKSVTLPSHKTTGLEIKKDAIAQGVPIKVTFSLFIVNGQSEKPVLDDEPVEVRQDEKFRAVACDDNS
jgi:hypothetical protein